MKRRILFIIVNVDSFFLSHRLPIGVKAKELGWDVYILSKDTGQRKEIESYGLKFIPVSFNRSGTNPLQEIRAILKLRAIINKYSPDLIHNVTIKPAIYGSIAAKYSRRSPKVINAISGLGYNFIEGRDGWVQRILRRLISFAFKSNVNFIFQNRDDCNLYKGFGLLKHNFYQIIKGSGVDGAEFPYHPPVEKDCLNVVLTARMLRDKGIMEFLEAADLLKEKWFSKAKFILVGGVDMGNKAGIPEAELRGQLIPGYIEWVGFQKDVRPFLVDSDIVTLPSYREGLPKSLIEAMAIGRPIITTDVPGCRECVEQNINGLLVPLKDASDLANALDHLLSNSDLRLKMGKASRKKMEEELSLEKVVNATMNCYKTILEGAIKADD